METNIYHLISVYCLACEQCQDRVKVSLRLSRAAPPGQSAKLGCVTRTAAGRLPRCRAARKMPAQHTLSANIPFMQAALHAWQAASQTSAQWQMLRHCARNCPEACVSGHGVQRRDEAGAYDAMRHS